MLVLNAGSLLVSTGFRKYAYFMLSFAVCLSFFFVCFNVYFGSRKLTTVFESWLRACNKP